VKVIADFCVIPMGVGVSVSPYIAECERIFSQAGLSHQLHAYGTNVEGEWDDVFNALKLCHARLHEMGALRISTTVKLGTRIDREQTMSEKIGSVENKLRAGS
jgi:uncharacterized protein (TIGR00106 family)